MIFNGSSHPLLASFRFFAFLFMLSFMSVATLSPSAFAQDKPEQKTFLEKWFPLLFGEDDKPGPEDTLVAPFATDKEDKVRQNSVSAPELSTNGKPLDEAHISYREIQDWVTDKVSQAMNFDNGTLESNVTDLQPHFTEETLQEYVNFLGSEGIYERVRREDKALSSVIVDKPVLTYWDDTCRDQVSEFIQAGRYHWRFDTRVVYSIIDQSQSGQAQAASATGNETSIRVLVARAPRSEAPDGLQVVGWSYADPC